MIAWRNVWKSFDRGATHVVRDFCLHVDAGETAVLIGSSGCGKTTCLKMINRLVEPTRGAVEFAGRAVREYDVLTLRRSIGYVFQGVGLFPHLTVEDNVALPGRLRRTPRGERRRRAAALLERVGLSPGAVARRRPRELSGGQQQRVGVARALFSDPDCLLMDEPFGALDAITREALQDEVLRLKRELHKTIVFVTHDILEALRLGDRIGVMNAGKLEQIGAPQELLHAPATPFVRALLARARRVVPPVDEA